MLQKLRVNLHRVRDAPWTEYRVHLQAHDILKERFDFFQHGLAVGTPNSLTLDAHNLLTLDVYRSLTLDAHNSLTLDVHRSLTLDVHKPLTLDAHNSLTLDVHRSLTLDAHNSPWTPPRAFSFKPLLTFHLPWTPGGAPIRCNRTRGL